ncbi:ParB/RepB/Spo0J family partition protein (plasmid) [Nostoc sp. C052]|uniref:ParB/RepB/Spo0J family partition protein n=1 Tax=Nostoc sp. C052 TaxID=2576902 RepID=UPI0015C32C67|nr:ParB/RepB/Spo0J family partition protein [Nostoc sp. C052]QLE46472.1 ParB/RepB/Spo0J family partition protein [Nostoc sp. C052]
MATNKREEPYASLRKPTINPLFNSTISPKDDSDVATVEFSKIKIPASQPRKYFDPQKLEELAHSIKQFGILEPLLVRPLPDGNYELVAGERRYRAGTMAGVQKAPIISKEMDDATMRQIRLVENLQREDLNPLEETEGILEILSLELEISIPEVVKLLYRMENELKGKVTRQVSGNSQTLIVEEIFTIIGTMRWDSFVRKRLPLLKLTADIMEMLRSGKLEFTKGVAISKVKNDVIRKEILEIAIANNLSVGEIKSLIAQRVEESSSSGKPEPGVLKERIDDAFGRFKKSKAWEDPRKKAKIEKLLAQLEALSES